MLSFEEQLWFGRMRRKAWQREEDARLDRLADKIVSRLKEPAAPKPVDEVK